MVGMGSPSWAEPARRAFTPRAGYIDPTPVLSAATRAIGADRIRCITVSGTAYGGRVGQQRYVKVEGDWPLDTLNNYARTMNWHARAMREEFDRTPGQTPASYKYGVGWMGGTPLQRETRQMFAVSGGIGWHRDGPNGEAGPVPAEIAAVWQLDLWMNPVGFLKAAALPGANPVAAWRWELGESGRDGPTTVPQKVSVVSISVGRYRIDATINARNLIQRLHTRFADPVLGDMNFEQEFTDDSYADLGGGMRFPTFWHSHQGYDDNYNVQTVSSGHNAFGGALPTIKVNDCGDGIAVPAGLALPPRYGEVTAAKLADGVYLLGGAPHNSVAIGFRDWVTVVEAPISEERSLAVIEKVATLFPGKPIRYLVNTHQHFDSIGGLRTYAHIGATIVTHQKNHAFYNRDVLNYTPRTVAPDLMSIMPPTELTEGYTYELVAENYVITDGDRILRINYAQPLKHVEGMLMVTLPREGLVIQSDMVDTDGGPPRGISDGAKVLYDMVATLGYRPRIIVPIHGSPLEWPAFLASTGVDRPSHPLPRPAPADTGPALSINSPIARIAADPTGRKILDRYLPGLTAHPSYDSFKDLTLPQLAPNSEGQIAGDQLQAITEALATLKQAD